jgi:hypothetical protein
MSRNVILAATAVSALAIATLAPTSASAFGNSGGHAMSMGHSSSMGHSMSVGRPMGHSPASRNFSHTQSYRNFNRGPSYKTISRGPKVTHHDHDHDHHHHDHDHDHHHHDHDHDHDHHCHHHHCGPHIGWWWWKHHHPYWVYPVGGETEVETVAAQPTYVAPVAKDNCNCLTKTYLDDGSVMFKDLCTKEAAVATPDELKAQAAGAPAGAK